MKVHRPEREIQKGIADYLKARGILCFRMQSGAMFGNYKGKSWAVRMCPPGTADILCFPRGKRPLWIEVKSSTGRLSSDQIVFCRIVAAEGHRYIVARCVADVEKEL